MFLGMMVGSSMKMMNWAREGLEEQTRNFSENGANENGNGEIRRV